MSFEIVQSRNISAQDACQLAAKTDDKPSSTSLTLVLLYGSWNKIKLDEDTYQNIRFLLSAMVGDGSFSHMSIASVKADESDESVEYCVDECIENGDGSSIGGLRSPGELPAIAVAISSRIEGGSGGKNTRSAVEYVKIEPREILLYLRSADTSDGEKGHQYVEKVLANAISGALKLAQKAVSLPSKSHCNESPLSSRDDTELTTRIFISGDRSHVGKSSVCLGMLGSLLRLGYDPKSLAYIKPATQCEATQLVEKYCKSVGVECVPVGPVVYFKGFTRAFLAGETDSTEKLLEKAGEAVDKLARGKRVIIIDGVGYPAVGSICGTDNASMARACGPPISGDSRSRKPTPVLLVGKSGVGDAVDAFNLNSTFFESVGVTVLGGIFNRLSLDGYYSLENCKKAVSSYFDQFKPGKQAFGFIPEVPGIAKTREKNGGQDDNGVNGLDTELGQANKFVNIFSEHVDVGGIVKAAREHHKLENESISRPTKRTKLHNIKSNGGAKPIALTREQIEQSAKSAGAAAGG